MQAFVGNRYNLPPPPQIIEAGEFECLMLEGETLNYNTDICRQWYACDTNNVPPQYVLQPTSSILEHHNCEHDDLRSADAIASKWLKISNELADVLRKCSRQACDKNILTLEQYNKYVTSGKYTANILN